MVMSNKAQAGNYALAFMLAVTVIILALSFAFPVNEMTTSAANETAYNGEVGSGMNCTGVIDDFTKAGCLVSDMGQGFFIGSLMAVAGIIIAGRVTRLNRGEDVEKLREEARN